MQQDVAFTGGTRKTVTQHVALTGGTRKQSRNNTLPSPVVYTKQTRNNTLPSPVVHAKNSHATTTCCPHRWNSRKQRQNNRSPSTAEYNNSHATTRCLHWLNTTVTSTQLPKPAVRYKKCHATTNSLD